MRAIGGIVTAVLLLSMAFPVLAPAQQPAPVGSYLLGPGDVIEISVWGNDDLSRTVTVRPDGRISLPLLGAIPVEGLTPEQLQSRLTLLYKRYVKNPQITVIIVQFRKLKVAVLGMVRTPATYDLAPGSTVLDAIVLAGGLTDRAAPTQAKLIRDARTVLPLDLLKVLAVDPAENLVLKDRDAILVPENLADVVHVLGEVRSPGVYSLARVRTLMDVLVLAGGLTQNASIKEARLVRDKKETIPLDLEALLIRGDASQDVALQGGDMIFVPVDTESRVHVLGQVGTPGTYLLRDAKTALRALTLAGGPTAKAALKDAYVIRRNSTTAQMTAKEPVIIKVNLDALLRGGDLSQDIPLQGGDAVVVPEQTLTAFNTLMQLVLSILTGVRTVTR